MTKIEIINELLKIGFIAIIAIIIISIYYAIVIKPIINEIKAINAKLDKLTEQNHDKPE